MRRGVSPKSEIRRPKEVRSPKSPSRPSPWESNGQERCDPEVLLPVGAT